MLFQKTILKKYLGLIDEEIVIVAWKQFQAYTLLPPSPSTMNGTARPLLNTNF